MNSLVRLACALAVATTLGTAAARADDKTFTVWWFDDPGSAEATTWAQALEDFKTSHPGVKVDFEQKSFTQLEQTGTMILNSDQVPDVLEYNKGNATSGLAASQGLLTPLDDVLKARGWDKTLNEGDLVLSRYDDKGVFGSGPVYGIAVSGEFVSVFYNQDMFAANSIKVPTTFDEFVSVLDAFKQKGIVPLAFSAGDPEPTLGTLVDTKIDQTWFQNYQGLKAPLDAAPYLFAGQTITDWLAKGYVPKDASGLKDDDAANLFIAGKSPMYIGGTWKLGSFKSAIKDFKWSQFLMPTNKYSVGSTGNLWIVPKGAKNKELAYDFIGLTLSPKIQTALANNGAIAIAADPSTITDEVGQREAALFKQVSDRGGLGFYLNWPVPGFYDALHQKLTGLTAGSLTPQQFADEIKKFYDDAQAAQ